MTDTNQPSDQTPDPRERREVVMLSLLVLLLVAGIGFGVYRLLGPHRTGSTAKKNGTPEIRIRPSIAVLGLATTSVDPARAWMTTAIPESLARALSASDTLRVIPAHNVARVRQELGFTDPSNVPTEILPRLRGMLDTDNLVFGTWTITEDRGLQTLQLDLRLLDTKNGTIAVVSVEDKVEAFSSLMIRGAREIQRKLQIAPLDAGAESAALASLPSNPIAASRYAEGLDAARQFRRLDAERILTKAVEADPENGAIRFALARALAANGHEARAAEEGAAAAQKAATLPPFLAARIRAFDLAAQDRAKAIEPLRKRFDSYPDDIDIGLDLISALTRAGKALDALVIVDRLRESPAATSSDPRIALAEAEAAIAIHDLNRLGHAATLAAGQAKAEGATWLLARARVTEGLAALENGNAKEASDTFVRAVRLFDHMKDRTSQVEAQGWMGIAIARSGDMELASSTFALAEAIAKQVGDLRSEALVKGWRGRSLEETGDLSGAMAAYQNAEELAASVGSESLQARFDEHLSILAIRRGNVEQARNLAEQALPMARRSGDPALIAALHLDLAIVQFQSADLVGARKSIAEALQRARSVGDPRILMRALEVDSRARLALDDLAGARSNFDELLRLSEKHGYAQGVSAGRFGLASLLAEEGKFAEAVKTSEGLTESFIGLSDRRRAALNLAMRAECLARLNRMQDAEAELKSSFELSPLGSVDRVRSEIAEAVVLIEKKTAPSNDEAARKLRALVSTAARYGDRSLEFDTRLLLGQVTLRIGDGAEGRNVLAVLAGEAKNDGFTRLQRLAGAPPKGP